MKTNPKTKQTMEKKEESKDKKDMLGKVAAGAGGAAAFVASTALAIDVLGEDGGEDLVAINPSDELGGTEADVEELVAYEAGTVVENIAEGSVEPVSGSVESAGSVEVYTAGDGGAESYLASADVHLDDDMGDLLSSNIGETDAAGIMDDMMDVVNDMV